MATSHGSPPKNKNSKSFVSAWREGPDGRQPWGPTLQTMNLQVRHCREAHPPNKATSKYATGKYATSKYATDK